MEKKERPLITDMFVFLNALLIDFPNYDGKTMTRVRKVSESSVILEEFFDDGHGHSNSASIRETPVDPLIFLEAYRKGFIAPLPMRNRDYGFCLSADEFILTHFGKIGLRDLFEHQELQRRKEKEKLSLQTGLFPS